MLLTIILPPPPFPAVILHPNVYSRMRAVFSAAAQLHGRKFNLIETVIYASPINTLAAKRSQLTSPLLSPCPEIYRLRLIICIDRISPPPPSDETRSKLSSGYSNVSFPPPFPPEITRSKLVPSRSEALIKAWLWSSVSKSTRCDKNIPLNSSKMCDYCD